MITTASSPERRRTGRRSPCGLPHAVLKDPASYIPPAKYPIIHQAAARRLRRRDGLKDGLIDDPAQVQLRSQGAAVQGRGRSLVPDRAAGGRGEEDLFARDQPAHRTGAVFVAGAGNGTGLGHSGTGSGAFGQYLRSVSIRRIQGPATGTGRRSTSTAMWCVATSRKTSS